MLSTTGVFVSLTSSVLDKISAATVLQTLLLSGERVSEQLLSLVFLFNVGSDSVAIKQKMLSI